MNITYNYKNSQYNCKTKSSFAGLQGIIVKGRETTAKIFAKNPDFSVYSRAKELCNHPVFRNSQIRIMPDVHPSSQTLVGLSIQGNPKHAIPSIISGDIGCGMLCVSLDQSSSKGNFFDLDNVIRTFLSGKHKKTPDSKGKHQSLLTKAINDLCKKFKISSGKMTDELGTLGGGNHFIEIDKDLQNNMYLVIHSGSRNCGTEVFRYYSKIAEAQNPYTIRALSYLNPNETVEYLSDMNIAMKYSSANRRIIADEILKQMGWKEKASFEAIHNYIDPKGIIRKGAISAEEGKDVIIPLNMRDGAVLAKGKGNPEWNFTAPHGAGRQFSRADASQLIGIEEYKDAMKGIHTSCVSEHTLDESPFAYKDPQDIIDGIKDTVDIKTVIKPTFNYKD